MTDTTLFDQIVSEVVRRLREMDASGNPTTSHPASCQSARKMVMTDRVVSLATLEGRLEGVKEIVVPANAVITPSARDELGSLDICVVREGKT